MIDETTKHILEIITNIQENMATKDDIKNMATKDDIASLEARMATKDDLSELRRDVSARIDENTKAIEELREEVHGMRGYAKEIDHVISRVSVLEHHAGAR